MIKKQKEKKITIDKLAVMIQEGFMAAAKQEDLMALTERMDKFEKNVDMRFNAVLSEQKEIRKEIKVNDLKNRGDVASLDFRVSKLEKKAGF
jgi:hypothetical protein